MNQLLVNRNGADVELDFLVSELIELVQPSAGVQAREVVGFTSSIRRWIQHLFFEKTTSKWVKW